MRIETEPRAGTFSRRQLLQRAGGGLGWIAARLAFQVLMLAILAFIGIALFGPTLRVLGVW